MLIGLATVLVLVGAVAGYAYYLTHDLNRVEVHGLRSAFTSAAGAISAPSSANPALAPWDPRACAPGAVPTAPVPNEP